MLRRLLLLCCLGLLTLARAQALEVSTIVSCKSHDEIWLCAAWKNGRVEVFRSETYFTKVEFDSEPRPGALDAALEGAQGGRQAAAPNSPSYTLQLLACRSQACAEQSSLLELPETRLLDVRRQGQLWHLVVQGRYQTTKAAQQAAAELIKKHGLKERPWVRTLGSLNRAALDQDQ